MFYRLILILTIVQFFSASSFAEGFYAGAGVGLTQIEDEDQGVKFEDNPFGWRVFAGYDLENNFAIEGSYVNSGEAKDDIDGTRIEAELTAFTLSVVGLVPMGESSQLFGKLGYFDGEIEASAFGFSAEDDEDGLTLGAGARFDLGNGIVIRGDVDWFDTELDTLWTIGVGVQFAFGGY